MSDVVTPLEQIKSKIEGMRAALQVVEQEYTEMLEHLEELFAAPTPILDDNGQQEFCLRGHARTTENTSYRSSGAKRCIECRRVSGELPQLTKLQENMEDIEDLLRFGATFLEIIERGPYSNWQNMLRGMQRAGREDLIVAMKEKKKLANIGH